MLMKKKFSISKIMDVVTGKKEETHEPPKKKKQPETIFDELLIFINNDRKTNPKWKGMLYLVPNQYNEIQAILQKLPYGDYPEGFTPHQQLHPDIQEIPGLIGRFHGVNLVKRY